MLCNWNPALPPVTTRYRRPWTQHLHSKRYIRILSQYWSSVEFQDHFVAFIVAMELQTRSIDVLGVSQQNICGDNPWSESRWMCNVTPTRVVLDSWVVNQIWLDSDSNESSQSWVDRGKRRWVESESNHADRHLSQSWLNWTLHESKLSHWFFWRENVKILHLFVASQGREPTFSYIWPHPPPPPPTPGQQLLAKIGKMWWVMSQIWLNSDTNELIRSWVRLANLGFELSRSWVTWIVTWVRVESARKSESSTTLTPTVASTLMFTIIFLAFRFDRILLSLVPINDDR